VIGERLPIEPGTITPLARDALQAGLHADILLATNGSSRATDVAIFEAFKAITNLVKAMNGLDLDGSKLIDRVFAGDNPTIQFVDLVTQTGRDTSMGCTSSSRTPYRASKTLMRTGSLRVGAPGCFG
jgi:hypothetical protein